MFKPKIIYCVSDLISFIQVDELYVPFTILSDNFGLIIKKKEHGKAISSFAQWTGISMCMHCVNFDKILGTGIFLWTN